MRPKRQLRYTAAFWTLYGVKILMVVWAKREIMELYVHGDHYRGVEPRSSSSSFTFLSMPPA